ncbi:RHS domain-containing protein [Burkholderia sp. Ac-20384]|uniref:RHS repeat domain-containing protein n=1 Tax=Burkholderia sp. Ac-20384 TaxID=2703902 RepID=UPI001F12132D|nr:RHS domain-containing protein [Burkholderia sp. Ac-20384]
MYASSSYVPLARIDQGKAAANDANARDAVYYFHNDVSGLPEELTSADGELIWQARYKVWGNAVQEEWIARAPQQSVPEWGEAQLASATPAHVPRPQNLRFQGQYLDRETGLHYNTFRFYDPDIGRFINPDPIGLMGEATYTSMHGTLFLRSTRGDGFAVHLKVTILFQNSWAEIRSKI